MEEEQDKIQQFIELQRQKGKNDAVTKAFLRSKGVDVKPYFGEDLQSPKDTRTTSKKVGDVLGGIFGGKVIGDYLGSKIAERGPDVKRLREQPAVYKKDGTQLLESGAETASKLYETPSAKQWAGEALTIGMNFLPATRVGKLLLGGKTAVGMGTKAFLGSAAKKAAGNAAYGAITGGARAAADDGDVMQGAALGAATMGGLSLTGSALKGLIINRGTKELSKKLYEWGLGLSKKNLAMEERLGHKKAEMLMDKIGAGTTDQIKQRVKVAYKEAEDQLQTLLTSSKIKYNKKQVLDNIVTGIQQKYKATLSPDDIQLIVEKMPLSGLRGKGTISQADLNTLRREFSDNFLTDNAWLAQELPQNKNAFRTAASVMSELVKKGNKKTEPQIRSLFAEESAFITALKGIEQIESRTMGPVNTAAQLMGPAAGAGAGFMAGGPVGAPIGAALEYLGSTTIGRTGAAVALRKAGIAVEKLSETQQAQFISLLAKLGIVSAE